MSTQAEGHPLLGSPLELPCGATLKNRLVKSPMSDSLGNGAGDPTDVQARLYERWAQGGVALSLIGEVQVDARFPEKPGNLVLHEGSDQSALRALTQRAVIDGAHLWAQLGYAGALSHAPISGPKGPAALDLDGLRCAGMAVEEIQALPQLFASAALRAKAAGFSGVQIHAGHGFLLSQFLSPLFNLRSDGYGGPIEGRARIVIEIVNQVRSAVGPLFPVGIRINATDQLEGGLTAEDALEAVRMLDRTSIDLIDLSGGTYFPGAKASSDGAGSGPYFLETARLAKCLTKVPVMATGGFKTRAQVEDAVATGSVDMVGIARAMVLHPDLPSAWLSEAERNLAFPRFEATPPGGVTAWYTMRLTALGEDREGEFDVDLPTAVEQYDARDAQRCVAWRNRFVLE